MAVCMMLSVLVEPIAEPTCLADAMMVPLTSSPMTSAISRFTRSGSAPEEAPKWCQGNCQ